jgi:hypothetical protein
METFEHEELILDEHIYQTGKEYREANNRFIWLVQSEENQAQAANAIEKLYVYGILGYNKAFEERNDRFNTLSFREIQLFNYENHPKRNADGDYLSGRMIQQDYIKRNDLKEVN